MAFNMPKTFENEFLCMYLVLEMMAIIASPVRSSSCCKGKTNLVPPMVVLFFFVPFCGWRCVVGGCGAIRST